MMAPQLDIRSDALRDLYVDVCLLGSGNEAILTEDERQRASRFHSADDRRRWVAGRSWLRGSLGALLDVDPAAIRFGYGSLGKPSVVWPASAIAFSFSHSGPIAMLAAGPFETLGVDIERMQRGVYDRPSAAIVLSRDEIEWIEAGPDHDTRFLRCWVRKEAFGKALGGGLNESLSEIDLTPQRNEPVAGLHVFDVRVADLTAALAVPFPRSSRVGELQ